MKVLIAAACLCIIGLTGWFSLSEYTRTKQDAILAMNVKCDPVWNASRRPDASKMTLAESREWQSTIDECIQFLKGK